MSLVVCSSLPKWLPGASQRLAVHPPQLSDPPKRLPAWSNPMVLLFSPWLMSALSLAPQHPRWGAYGKEWAIPVSMSIARQLVSHTNVYRNTGMHAHTLSHVWHHFREHKDIWFLGCFEIMSPPVWMEAVLVTLWEWLSTVKPEANLHSVQRVRMAGRKEVKIPIGDSPQSFYVSLGKHSSSEDGAWTEISFIPANPPCVYLPRRERGEGVYKGSFYIPQKICL